MMALLDIEHLVFRVAGQVVLADADRDGHALISPARSRGLGFKPTRWNRSLFQRHDALVQRFDSLGQFLDIFLSGHAQPI